MNAKRTFPRARRMRGIERLEARSLLAGVPFSFALDDPQGDFAAFPALLGALEAAGEILTGLLQGEGSLEVRVIPNNDIPFARGGATAVSVVGMNGAFQILAAGTVAEARTGDDPNGAEADILIELNSDTYLPDVFFDPSGAARTAPLPAEKEDFISTALHELVHALGFQGYRNIVGDDYGEFTFEFPAGTFLQTAYDALTEFGAGALSDVLFFTGENAVANYGGPVPLTSLGPDDTTGENFYHLGNDEGSVGDDLIPDLMNGIVFFPGRRYVVGELDLAILTDLGWTLTPPVGSSWTNPDEATDVNDDGETDLNDLLAIVFDLREHGATHPLASPPTPPPYLDVDADGKASVGDLLRVVTVLREQLTGSSGEGERETLDDAVSDVTVRDEWETADLILRGADWEELLETLACSTPR